MWLANNYKNIAINFHQDFVDTLHTDFFQEHMDRDIFYLPNHSVETWLIKQEREEETEIKNILTREY